MTTNVKLCDLKEYRKPTDLEPVDFIGTGFVPSLRSVLPVPFDKVKHRLSVIYDSRVKDGSIDASECLIGGLNLKSCMHSFACLINYLHDLRVSYAEPSSCIDEQKRNTPCRVTLEMDVLSCDFSLFVYNYIQDDDVDDALFEEQVATTNSILYAQLNNLVKIHHIQWATGESNLVQRFCWNKVDIRNASEQTNCSAEQLIRFNLATAKLYNAIDLDAVMRNYLLTLHGLDHQSCFNTLQCSQQAYDQLINDSLNYNHNYDLPTRLTIAFDGQFIWTNMRFKNLNLYSASMRSRPVF